MQNKYEVIGIVGEGAYGIVMKCRNKETNEIVAIKKFKDGEEEIVQKSMLRELKVLKKLRHENIVQLKESFRRKGKLYLVFEYVDRNLLEILEQYPNGLDQNLVKRFIYQLCKSLIYIHNNEMIHRDIKPENILITNDLQVKVCDFGFTRSLPQKGGILTDYVATRWYRAPELLLGCSNYGKEIDFWAVGCIMGEITDGKAMFPSENELEQLYMIQKLFGTLPQNMLEMFSANPRFSGYKLDQVVKPETLERKYYGKLNKQAFSFMKALLKLDPRERLGGADVISHPYFEDMRNEDPEFNGLNNINSKVPINSNNNINTLNTNTNLQATKSNVNIANYGVKGNISNNTNNPQLQNKQNPNNINIISNNPIKNVINKNIINPNNFKDEDDVYNTNMNATQKGKFLNTKNNFNINQNFQQDFLNLQNNPNNQNYSKSPPKEVFTINLNINNQNQIINKFSNVPAQQPKQQNKKFHNFDNNSASFNFMVNSNMGNMGYQTFYNIVNNKDDIYNFDIDTNFEEKNPNEKKDEVKKIGPIIKKNTFNPNNSNLKSLIYY